MASPYTKSPPPAPADAEVVRNIEVLAAFVARTGTQFEQLARAKTLNDPKFVFLLEGSPAGSEAARAQAFYQWKKQRLEQRVFASDGSDDLQLKICAMVDGDLKWPFPSDAHVMDNVKPLPPDAAEKKKSEGSVDGVCKAEILQVSNSIQKLDGVRKDEISQVNDSMRKPGRPPDRRTRDDMKPPQSTAPHKRKLDSMSPDRSKNGVPLADSVRRPQQAPLQEVLDDTKQPLSKVENERTTLGASQDSLSSRLSQPVQGVKDLLSPPLSGDSQMKEAAIGEPAQKAGTFKNDLRNSPSGLSKASGEVGLDQQAAESTEKHAKENHGLKLLKAAIADYVKEVLNPAWKEGNMSKEAFKSIVKKVVDKVCLSLQAHQIPKSQENVDQYMAQSQGKIAKLVQGYVDRLKKN